MTTAIQQAATGSVASPPKAKQKELGGGAAEGSVFLVLTPDGVEIGNESQRLRFSRACPSPLKLPSPTAHLPVELPSGPRPRPMRMTGVVRAGGGWETLFDLPCALVQGEQFELVAEECVVQEESPKRAAILLTGRQMMEGYRWKAEVEARAGSPLIHVVVTVYLERPLVLSGPQPSAVLWAKGTAPEVVLDQGPGNIYTGPAECNWGNGFPAAYFWKDGKEAAVFAQMSRLTWMTGSRFRYSYRVQTLCRGESFGLGLHALQVNRNPLPAGEHVVADYYVYAAPRADRPTRLQALDRMIDVFGECHPPDAERPVNYAGGPTTWEHFAKGQIRNLLVQDTGGNPGACWDHVQLKEPWNDSLTEPVEKVRISPDYALKSGSWPACFRDRATDLWDFSTCFNYVAPWLAIERLEPHPVWRQALSESVRSMPTFYNPEARMILRQHGRPPYDMPWQVFTFHYEMLKVHDMAGPEHFNPAVAGTLLQSVPGLIQLAHNERYVFSQFIEPYGKFGTVNLDISSMGQVREPWQVGSYAWILARAFEMTGQRAWLDEAGAAIRKLLDGSMSFTVSNPHYSVTYREAVDFPITEIFGNGFGIAACQKLHELTGDATFARYARDFLNNLLRCTFWYESSLDTDPRDCILKNLGLFQAFHSYAGAAPWETIEAYLPMTVMLRAENPLTPVGLLMRLFNTMRQNAFWFYPPVFYGETAASRQLMQSPADYLSIENFYMPERGGDHGGMGRCIYMGQLSLWAYLLFEAMAQADDERIMVLNLDVLVGFHEAATGAARHFYLFNPTPQERTFRLRSRVLGQGEYQVLSGDSTPAGSAQRFTREQLAEGIPFTLAPLGWKKITIEHANAAAMRAAIRSFTAAQNSICHAYAAWQALRAQSPSEAKLSRGSSAFGEAMRRYAGGEYERAVEIAGGVVQDLQGL